MLQVKMFSNNRIEEVERAVNEWIALNGVRPIEMQTTQSDANARYGELCWTITLWYEK